jgi:hypothetical protein
LKNYLTILLAVIVVGAVPGMLTGCATVSATTKPAVAAAPETLLTKWQSDLNQAILDAKAAGDLMAPVRANCYETLLSLTPQLPNLNVVDHKPAGVVDAFELGAQRVEVAAEIADYQIPPAMKVQLVVACGPLKARAGDILLLFNLKAASIAGQISLLPK